MDRDARALNGGRQTRRRLRRAAKRGNEAEIFTERRLLGAERPCKRLARRVQRIRPGRPHERRELPEPAGQMHERKPCPHERPRRRSQQLRLPLKPLSFGAQHRDAPPPGKDRRLVFFVFFRRLGADARPRQLRFKRGTDLKRDAPAAHRLDRRFVEHLHPDGGKRLKLGIAQIGNALRPADD